MVFVRYLGHSSFEFITKSRTNIVIDPYQNKEGKNWFSKEFPNIEADFVVVTHDHFDHNAVSKVLGSPKVINKVGKIEGNDFTLRSLKGEHARAFRYMFYENRIIILETEGLKFCHWGDNKANVDKKLLKELEDIDVMMIPVDESEHLLEMKDVFGLIDKIFPRIVIPMHYFNEGLTTKESMLKPIDKWLKKFKRVRNVPSSGIDISINGLPKDQETWVFERFLN